MKLIKNKIENRGFTLVELLVVIAIIAILSVIGLTVFSGVQRTARDARRKSDVDAIAAAIETTRTPGSLYYASLPNTSFSAGVVPTDSTTAQYCIKTSVSGAALAANPAVTAWGVSGCIDNTWFAIASTGLPAGVGATSASVFGDNITGWKVCARLENDGTTAVAYCKTSSQ